MIKSDTLQKLAPALVAAQAELPTIKLDAKADIPTKSGGKYTYEYATLANVMQTIGPVLAKYELAIVQVVTTAPSVQTILLHTSGEHIGNDIPIKADGGPQAVGSEISYARRYGVSSLLALVTQSDDDGAAAQAVHNNRQEQRQGSSSSSGGECTGPQRAKIWAMAHDVWPSHGDEELKSMLSIESRNAHLPDSTRDMTKHQASMLIEILQKKIDEQGAH